ncbi:hypothetical protein Tco_0802070 [Tanacetum coccineum]|uniref:Uncharacterized protein n=1 Tax=Tanacetum coccineum TaxID=301880 RepID=A0ABQ4ZYL0_9ASTR
MLVLNVDQSFINGVSADVDMTYSSKFSPCKGSNHGLLSNLSKSPREILAIEKAAIAFDQPPCMVESRRSRNMSKYYHFHEDHRFSSGCHFYLKDETTLSECDEEEQKNLYFNDLFPFNIIYPDDSKLDKDNDDHEIDIK